MKKFIAAAAFLAAFVTAPAFAGVEIGKAAPDHTFKDIAGVEHSIAKFKGKIVVLEWTNPGCPFVHKFYDNGDLPRMQNDAKKNADVVWIAVNSSAAEKEGYFTTDAEAAAWAKENTFAGNAYVRDPSGVFGKLYGAKTTPHMFVINKDGTVAYAGAIDNVKSADSDDIATADNYVLAALKAIEGGKTPTVTSTEPYGCGVKY